MMPNDLIVTSRTDVELKPAPIEPSWIIEGNPVATNCTLSRSADGMASTSSGSAPRASSTGTTTSTRRSAFSKARW